MNPVWLLRMTGAVLVACLACASVATLLLLQPPACSVATMFTGLILFLVGAELGLRWSVAIGGVLMFGGVFAAALLGAIG